MKALLVFGFAPFGASFQPKVISHDERNRDNRPTDNHEARIALLLAIFFGFLRRAGGKLGGGLR